MTATKVNACEATDCAYNEGQSCRALAITVGMGNAASCGTYTPREQKAGVEMTVASVGACKVAGCKHNKDLVCTAAQVTIGVDGAGVTCKTYEPA